MLDGAEYIAKAIRLEHCPQWGEDAWSWTLRSDYTERIVRCKDCKFIESLYASKIEGSWFPDGVGHCTKWNNFNCEVDGFCKWGKPKEDTCR